MMSEQDQLLFYYQCTDLWKRFCEEHNQLFEVTCDEYLHLLDSNMEALEIEIEKKKLIIERISKLESLRQELINQANLSLPDEKKISSVGDLILLVKNFETESKNGFLQKFNQLLIDIIEKIQAQNKRNQLFINKAVQSLKDIREAATGEKSYSTYTSRGATTQTVIKRD